MSGGGVLASVKAGSSSGVQLRHPDRVCSSKQFHCTNATGAGGGVPVLPVPKPR